MLPPAWFQRLRAFVDRRGAQIAGAFVCSLIIVFVELLFSPFSKLWTGLFFFLINAFFLVALVVLSRLFWTRGTSIARGLRDRGARPAFGNATTTKGRPLEAQGRSGQRNGVWDRWLDGP